MDEIWLCTYLGCTSKCQALVLTQLTFKGSVSERAKSVLARGRCRCVVGQRAERCQCTCSPESREWAVPLVFGVSFFLCISASVSRGSACTGGWTERESFQGPYGLLTARSLFFFPSSKCGVHSDGRLEETWVHKKR